MHYPMEMLSLNNYAACFRLLFYILLQLTSTIGIKKKNDNGWTPLPVPAVEPEPIQLPQFEAPDINWGYVAAGVAAGVIIAGAIVLAPETGGASLVALAAV